jgi:hypothetical protein
LGEPDQGNKNEDDRGEYGKKILLKQQSEVESATATEICKWTDQSVAACKARRQQEALLADRLMPIAV